MEDKTFDEIFASMRKSAFGQIAEESKTNVNPSVRDTTYNPIRKSASDVPDVGRRLATVKMVKAMAVGGPRPDAVASVHGDATRPTLQSIKKSSAKPTVMGPASDRWKTVENDWEEYNAFISNSE